jgi:predicted metal-dependent hydrolase
MENPTPDYDPRYLAGILFFNDRDFFEAHEVWEGLWLKAGGPERKFYQGLIQAAVALFHFSGGNLRGAMKLYRSAHNYMKELPRPYLGLAVDHFWEQMGRCFAELLTATEPPRELRPSDDLMPMITLDPPPVRWPDLAEFESNDE